MLCYTITDCHDRIGGYRLGQDQFRRPPESATLLGAARSPAGLVLCIMLLLGRRRLGAGLVVMSAAAIRLDDLTVG
jgi:hypothetical protein